MLAGAGNLVLLVFALSFRGPPQLIPLQPGMLATRAQRGAPLASRPISHHQATVPLCRHALPCV